MPDELTFQIERWPKTHSRFEDLRHAIEVEKQTEYLEFTAPWHQGSHMLVALQDTNIVGFLRFVVQVIGPDDGLPPVQGEGKALAEAKILTFGVVAEVRNQGVGRALQLAGITWARELGCYQVRSHSDGVRHANHHLKLSLGFAVHPIERGEDKRGVYFIMPLRAKGV
jgi:GNAT superfamily N-acetyltransferase